MTPRSSGFLAAFPVLAIAACGGQFTTEATNGSDAGVGGSTSTGGRTGAGGSPGGKGGSIPGTGGISRGGSVGAGGSIGAGGTTSSSEDAFRTELMRLYCSAFAGCCSSGGIALDQAQCEASFATLISGNLSSPRSGYYTFDAAAADRCLEMVRAAQGSVCGNLPSSIACEGVFQGILKPGDPCNTAVECARGPGDSQSCDPGPDGTTICIVKRRAAEGQQCVQNCEEQAGVTTCSGSVTSEPDRGRCFQNDGLFCSGGLCARQVDVGSLCTDERACAGDATCDSSVGICVPLAAVGEPCSVTNDCREELHCSTGVCTPDHSPGEACDQSSECGAGSCRAGVCSSLGLGIAIICAALSGAVPVP